MNGFVFYPENALIKDKPQAYISGCLSDSDIFRHTYELLLSSCPNLIIWGRRANAEYDPEEFETLISRMNLFVFTVSVEAVSDETFRNEAKYVLEHNLPVLPLIQKGVSVKMFEGLFGNIQFLDENNVDSTALSFKEKLKNYLNSIMISDELRQRIKKVFRADIFLSYRKKDRIHANRIMELVHKSEILRDVAIWYDEFLVPGEDYDEEIKGFLNDSDLFVLAVTPNILEENNYVMLHEYPDAHDRNKKIVPIEAVPTDREIMSEKFNEIPEIISIDDEQKVEETLIGYLSSKMSESEAPERDFLLGMAYLMGVSVEKNYTYAAEYIERAAVNGSDEAYEKIVTMYENGEGVRINIDKALEWQEKYYIKLVSRPKPDIKKLIRELFRLGCMTVSRYEKNRKPTLFTKKAKTPEEAEAERKEQDRISTAIDESNRKILDVAKQYFDDTVKLINLFSEKDPLYYFEKMAEYYDACIDLYRRSTVTDTEESMKNAENSVKYKRGYLKYKREYLGINDDPEMKLSLGESLMRLGDVLTGWTPEGVSRENEYRAAEYYCEAQEFFTELAQNDDSIRLKRDVAKLSGFFVSYVIRHFDTFEDAEKKALYYADGYISTMETICLQTGKPEDARELADAYFFRGKIYNFEGDSIEYLKKSIEILEKAWNDIKAARNSRYVDSSSQMFFQLLLVQERGLLKKLTEERQEQ